MSWIRKSRFLHLPVFALAALTCGCGGGASGPTEPALDLVPATVTVTIGDKPLADADVSFNFDGVAPKGFVSSGGRTDASGKAEVKTLSKPGTVAGKYKVTISKLTMADGSAVKNDPAAGIDIEQLKMQEQVKESIPLKYTVMDQTDLLVEVTKGGKNDFELKLTEN